MTVVCGALSYIKNCRINISKDFYFLPVQCLYSSVVDNKMATKGNVFCHVEKSLKALEKLPRVALNNIRDSPEAFKPVCYHVYAVDFYFERNME